MAAAAKDGAKPSKIEEIKTASNGLAGSLREVYESDASHFDEGDVALIKHHGSYQQDDRDLRADLKRAGQDKAWSFMVRTKIPGGRLTAEQYLAEDEIATRFANGTIRITSRQGLQLHGVGKENLKNSIKAINEATLTTLGACGDVNRNTLACPVSDLDWRHGLGLETLAKAIADRFTPRSTAYYEIWCDGEKLGHQVTPTREEPLYGKTYLPRKFKMAVGLPEDNCVDMYAEDLSAEAVHDGTRTLAWDILAGGGLGFKHSKTETYPRIASRIVRVPDAEVLDVIETVVKIQRDFGDRTDRDHARLKYTIDDRGLDWFKNEIRSRMKKDYEDAGPMPKYQVHDHLGWHEDRFGKLYVGIRIESGRIADTEKARAKTGLREVVARFRPEVRLTTMQNIILAGIDPANRAEIERILGDHGVSCDYALSALRRRSMACPALPTCGLALAEAERALPGILDQLEALGDGDVQLELRMTGCPNSCVRTPMAELGIAGRGPGKYTLYAGGSHELTRLAYVFRETVEEDHLPAVVHGMISAWRKNAAAGESFGDWSGRAGREQLELLTANAG